MVIVTNLKPVLGDLESKNDRRPRTIHYFRLLINSGQHEQLSGIPGSAGSSSHIRLRSMSDIRLSFLTTQVLQHLPQTLNLSVSTSDLTTFGTVAVGGGGLMGSSLTVLSGAS